MSVKPTKISNEQARNFLVADLWKLFVFLQSIGQVFGEIVAKIKYGSKISAESYQCKAEYILPFEGKWTVANGGITKETSHSWDLYYSQIKNIDYLRKIWYD